MKPEFKYGLIIGCFGFFNVILEYLPIVKPLGNIYFSIIWTLYFIIPLIFYFLVVFNKRKSLGGNMLWVEGTRMGAYIALIGALVMVVLMILFFTLIKPEFFNEMVEYGIKQGMDEKSALTYYSFSSYLYFAFLRSIMLGVVFSAIFSFFLKKKANNQD